MPDSRIEKSGRIVRFGLKILEILDHLPKSDKLPNCVETIRRMGQNHLNVGIQPKSEKLFPGPKLVSARKSENSSNPVQNQLELARNQLVIWNLVYLSFLVCSFLWLVFASLILFWNSNQVGVGELIWSAIKSPLLVLGCALFIFLDLNLLQSWGQLLVLDLWPRTRSFVTEAAR